jgi:hypothetical protein
MATLWLPCGGYPVVTLRRLPCGYPAAVTLWLPCGGYPVMATLWLPCGGYPVMATLRRLPCDGYPVMATLRRLPCDGYPVVILSRDPRHHATIKLSCKWSKNVQPLVQLNSSIVEKFLIESQNKIVRHLE